MVRKPCSLIALGLLVAGCSSTDKVREEPDVTPMHPTAVLETHVVSDGLKGFVPFEGTTKSFTRADMRREETTLKGTGSVSGWFVGTNNSARIERLDRKLVWTLDQKARTYTECPLKGCPTPAAESPQEATPGKQDKPREPECRVKIAGASFTVKPTGEKRSINGFDTEQYQVAWQVTLQDPQARKTVSTLNVDLWTTPATRELKDALAVEQAYARALASNLAAAGADKAQIVPAEASKMITAYLGELLTPSDKAALFRAGKELEKVKGYTILSQLTWDLRGDACAGKDGEPAAASSSSKSSVASSVGSAVSSVTEWFAKKKTDEKAKEVAAKPILSFTTEVKSHRVEPVRDGTFAPPPTYKPANPK